MCGVYIPTWVVKEQSQADHTLAPISLIEKQSKKID